ncbi:MAG TPA: pentapeptide repeat-containing protein, partial [Thermoanaerobaculia bacterium]|nr:pentapeptide repeat-containing protein [Thermoanaerobaculia bacterium]
TEQQVKNALGERVDLVPGNRIALLRPFDREQIRRFLIGFCGDEATAEARLKLIESVNDLMGLSHNPRMLGFIAELPEESLLAAREGNREITAAELYRLILTRWLEGEVDRVQPRGARPGLSIEDRWRAVTALARRLWQKTDSFISLAELEEDTARVLESLGAASLEPEVAVFQVASGTLLVRDGEGRFAFLHQSILEWLVAREAAREIETGVAPETLSCRDLSPLMADFLISLCEPDLLKSWLSETGGSRSDERTRNGLLVAQRLERLRASGGEAGGSIEILPHGLRGVDLSGQDLSGADFSEADFTDAVLVETLLIGANLRKARLGGAKLNRSDLTNADLSGADLTETDLTGARLIGADLRGARMEGALLHRAKLLGARWDRSAARTLRAAGDSGAALGDLDGFRAVVSFPNLYGDEVAWSPDGGLLAAAQRLCARLLDASTGQEGPRIGRHRGTIHSLAFSPCGRYLATGSEDGTAVLWNLADGGEFQRFELQSVVRSLSFSPDGNWLACGLASGRAVVWTVPGGRQLRQLAGNAGQILRLAFAQDGKALVAATEKGSLITWSMPAGQETARVSGHGEISRHMDQSCSPDGRLLAIGGGRGTVIVQDTADATSARRLEGHEGAVRAVCFDPAGRRLASGGDDASVRLWDLSKTRELLRMDEDAQISGLSFSPDGRTLAIRSGERVRLREASTGRELRSFRNLGRRLRDVNFSPGGRSLVSASRDGFVSVWNLGTGRETLRLGELWSPRSVAFSREGDRILGGSSEGTLCVWDAATGRVLQRLESDTPIRDADFSPDGWRIVSGGDQGAVKIWKVTSGKMIRSLTAGSASIESVVFSPDGRRVAAGSYDGTIYLWGTGRQARSLRTGVSPVSSVTFNAEGGLIACGSWGQQVQVWDLATERVVSQFGGHLGRVRSV